MSKSLNDRLAEFARGLAAEKFSSYGYRYGDDVQEQIDSAVGYAVAECKAEIGRRLLDALDDRDNDDKDRDP